MRDSQERAGSRILITALEEIADNLVDLNGPTAFNVPQHRSGHAGSRLGKAGSTSRNRGSAGREAFQSRDGGALVEESCGQAACARGHDVADRGAHQAGDSRPSGDENPFLPHLLQDVLARTSVEFGSGEGSRDVLAAV